MRIKKVKIGLGCHLVIKVLINGKEARFLIDTGASRTMLCSEQYRRYMVGGEQINMCQSVAGIGGTTSEVNEIILNKLQVETLVWQNYKFLMSSMKHINEQYQSFGLKNIQGILGADLLVEGKAYIDLLKDELVFR